mmetsp:Transcript_30553/g.87623  ORF Transcript_30553/g.87623 Transcript_30553/m.87623 type:complete len:203 (-) Transcript_30553:414-1022(-)
MECVPGVCNVNGKLSGSQGLLQVLLIAVFIVNAEEDVVPDGSVDQKRHLRLVGDGDVGDRPLTLEQLQLAQQRREQRGLARADGAADQHEFPLSGLEVDVRENGLRLRRDVLAILILLWRHRVCKGRVSDLQRSFGFILGRHFRKTQEVLDALCSVDRIKPRHPARGEGHCDHQQRPHIGTGCLSFPKIHSLLLDKHEEEAS